ncbi:MAG TPA: GNAT family N-acetyltransferase [Gaiellaceae bacterium]|nr:GNAT family N-acetyltransferase [Gaiellaceae bacterium]
MTTAEIRFAVESDLPFLERMLSWAAGWRSNVLDETLAVDPAVARYLAGWGRPGDVALVAETAAGEPAGAAWYRLFAADDPGFGFVAPDIPELTVAVEPAARGTGLGTALLTALVDRARADGFEAVSLSVEVENPAKRLYERLNFEIVAEGAGNACTLLLRL